MSIKICKKTLNIIKKGEPNGKLSVNENYLRIKKSVLKHISKHGYITISAMKQGALRGRGLGVSVSETAVAIQMLIDNKDIHAISHEWNGRKTTRFVAALKGDDVKFCDNVNDAISDAERFKMLKDIVLKYVNSNGFITDGIARQVVSRSKLYPGMESGVDYPNLILESLVNDRSISEITHKWNGRSSKRFVIAD